MNIKEFIIPLILAIITTGAIHYFFLQRTTQPTQISTFVAPTKVESKPIRTEVDFWDNQQPIPEQKTAVETSWAQLNFTNHGAALESLLHKRNVNGKTDYISTLPSEMGREYKAFTVAFDDKTPYYYTLIGQEDTQDTINVTYQSASAFGYVKKTFKIYKDKQQLDLLIQLTANQQVTPRIFLPSPHLAGDLSTVSAIVVSNQAIFEKIAYTKLLPGQGWLVPQLFGMEDKYFIHAFIHDNNLLNRAYFLTQDKNIISILEGNEITKDTQWQLSFYMGPKELNALTAVDTRLEQAMDYGWLGPISKILLVILNWFYSYVHNYGLAIIILTLLIKLLLLPFAIHGQKGLKKRMDMQKKLAYLQQRYKDDPQTLAHERAELLKKQGLDGIGGCLPALLQIPVFFALSRVLSSSFELYKAPMLWIPDLSARDPYYILPVLVTVSMLGQALVSDPKQRLSLVAMAFIFGAVTASMSAGLALYIAVNTIVSVLQTVAIERFKFARD